MLFFVLRMLGVFFELGSAIRNLTLHYSLNAKNWFRRSNLTFFAGDVFESTTKFLLEATLRFLSDLMGSLAFFYSVVNRVSKMQSI